MAIVVLVTDRHSVRNTLRPALLDAGYEVTSCVGPQPFDYMCRGSRCGWCPLAERADAIILDSDVAGDHAGGGTTADDLVRLYRRMGRPVVLLADTVRGAPWQGDPEVDVLPLGAGPRHVLQVTARAIARRPHGQATRAPEPEELAGPKRWVDGTTVSVADR
jgi:hypothetical protein